MKILSVNSLAIPDIKVIRYARFMDHRGYFSEPYRKSDVLNHPELAGLQNVEFVQSNESYSHANTVRGLHFQWDPPMGKLVRTVRGRMIDMALDIRKSSPTFGKIILYDMPCQPGQDYNDWIWLPPGFAHGNIFTEETTIEYYCSGEYNSQAEAGISPLAQDLDWSLCEPGLRDHFNSVVKGECLMSDKDKAAFSLGQWSTDSRSANFN